MNCIDEREAVVKCIWSKCKELDFSKYYIGLSNDNYDRDKLQRINDLNESEKSLDIRYKEVIGLHEVNCLYDSSVSDSSRIIITRWRLSNFSFAIETGRYTRPKTPRNEKLCKICLVVEDEHHVIFICPLYNQIRSNHVSILTLKKSVKSLLNPRTKYELYETAKMLSAMEKLHWKFCC